MAKQKQKKVAKLQTRTVVEKRDILEELRDSYLDYAMSVIVARALPDVRDGLKPVQRRILYAMKEMGLGAGSKHRKSATVVGEVLGKYHPHGDTAVYDTIARMAQDFSLRYPLIDGQGNFGSIDGDSPAAMRYCVTGDTRVVAEGGLIPIAQMAQKQNKNEEDISIKILSKDKTINRAIKWFDSGEHPTIKIETNRGFSLRGSYNHPILVWDRNLISGALQFRWKLLSQIKKGDTAVIDRTDNFLWPEKPTNLKPYYPNRKNKRVEKKILPEELDEDLAYILGTLVAEGTIKKKELEFCNSDKNWIEAFKEIWAKIFPDCRLHYFERKPSSFGKKPYYTLEIHSQYVIEFLRNIGLKEQKSAAKTVPELVFRSPKKVAASFLRAYGEGDGSISFSGKMTELSYISKSETLIEQLQLLLLRLGIVGTKRYDRYRQIHKLYIRGLDEYLRFQKLVGFLSSVKNKKLAQAINRLTKSYSQTDFIPFIGDYVRERLDGKYKERAFAIKHNFDRYPNMEKYSERVATLVKPTAQLKVKSVFENLLENNYLFEPITKVEYGAKERVYSIKVASGCHSFVANGFINHNTETRLSHIGETMLADIEKNTVDFSPNYDETKKEPNVLPTNVPQLLLNGSIGIAVGMATNIPPHNFTEVADAITYLLKKPDAPLPEIMKYIKGPDFPTGGIIYNQKDIREAYASGRGGVVTRGETEIVETESAKGRTRQQILIRSIPYQVNKASLIIRIAELVQDKKIEGIHDIRDESDKEGLRIAIDLKDGAHPKKILNGLYKYTDLEKTFHINMVALIGGTEPQTLSLKSILEHFITHRREVLKRRTAFDLARAEERLHILEGLRLALENIDAVIKTIKRSRDAASAKQNLIAKFKLTDRQSQAILDMRLQTLAGLEREKVETEFKQKKEEVRFLKSLLADPKKLTELFANELSDLKKKFGDERKTQVHEMASREISMKDIVPDEETVITLTTDGSIKRGRPTMYKKQKRGGKGIAGVQTKEQEKVLQLVVTTTHRDIFFFSNIGKIYKLKAYEIPQVSRTSRGRAIQNFLSLSDKEHIVTLFPIEVGAQSKTALLMLTASGIIKKVALNEFLHIRSSGIAAIKLRGGDRVVFVGTATTNNHIVVVTKNGRALVFNEKDIRATGRQAAGVRAIRLQQGDSVVAGGIAQENLKSGSLLVVSENGFGKQTALSQYRSQRRGGSGVKTLKTTAKTGAVITAAVIQGQKDIIVISNKGQVLKTDLQSVPQQSRATQGVRIIKLPPKDSVVSIITL